MAHSTRHSRFPAPFVPSFLLPLFLPLALSLLLIGCANPVAPGGGPRDTTPPRIVRSVPDDGAVNVDRRSIEIAFSEYVDRGSFEQAVSVTPAFESPLEIDFGGRGATVRFPEPLRENTTYILTLDKNLTDVRNVSLDAPITIAFATGPTINRGQLAGRVVAAETGGAQEGLDIYAYALSDSTTNAPSPPDSLPPRPAYRTQTDSEGRFQFEYLQEQPYYVVALADANRNRQPDPLEAYAVPPRPALVADSAGTEPDQPWVATVRDPLAPTPVRVQSRSQRRHAVRFDEPVRLLNRTPAHWQLYDSLGARSMRVGTVYRRPVAPNLVVLRTEPLAATPHRLIVPDSAVVDSSGNANRADTLRFTPVEAADTLRTRFVRFMPDNLTADTTGVYPLLPDETPGVRFNEPVDSTRLRALISARDTAGTARPFTVSTSDGTTYTLHFDPPLRPDDHVQVRVDGPSLSRPDTLITRTFRRISNRQLGTVSGTVAFADTVASDSTAAGSPSTATAPGPDTPPIVVELFAANPPSRATPRQTTASAKGTFAFPQLPEGEYRFRAFLDRNRNGRWDGGQIIPFRAAEPITWSDGTISNRPRWDNVLETPLRLPLATSP